MLGARPTERSPGPPCRCWGLPRARSAGTRSATEVRPGARHRGPPPPPLQATRGPPGPGGADPGILRFRGQEPGKLCQLTCHQIGKAFPPLLVSVFLSQKMGRWHLCRPRTLGDIQPAVLGCFGVYVNGGAVVPSRRHHDRCPVLRLWYLPPSLKLEIGVGCIGKFSVSSRGGTMLAGVGSR